MTRVQRVFDLTSPERTVQRDRALGASLAFVAGATNAGGFLAVGQYTSHMTGIVSTLAEDLAAGRMAVALWAASGLLAFVGGAMTTAMAVNWARRHELRSRFAVPLLLEAALLFGFGSLGGMFHRPSPAVVPAIILTLCFLMGLQNAVITKISGAVIRTTHVTGLLTDIGIELGRLFYINGSHSGEPVRADRQRLTVHLLLLGNFLGGGVSGALSFREFGPFAAIPLAAVLTILAVKPVLADIRAAF